MPAPIRLPQEPSPLARSLASLRRVRGVSDLSKWSFASFRLAGLPLRIRPAFILYTFLTLLILSALGFHPTLASHLAPPDVPFSDKLLHFVCFFIATFLFYRIWVVEENGGARRVWYWAWFNELVTAGTCVFAGGILSEFLQSLLPYKSFQPLDILANLLGSSLALFLSSRMAKARRRERELRRLYGSLAEMGSEDEGESGEESEGETEEGGRGEREMEEGRGGDGARTRRGGGGGGAGVERNLLAASSSGGGGGGGEAGGMRGRKAAQDPWNASVGEEEIFGLGGDDDDEDDEHAGGGRGGGGRTRGPL